MRRCEIEFQNRARSFILFELEFDVVNCNAGD